jgi:hypothetical protein
MEEFLRALKSNKYKDKRLRINWMLLAIISLITALTISGVAIYYSVIGLTAIFAAAAIPIMVMGVSLEVAKLVATVWLHRNWRVAPGFIKTYLTVSVVVLMLITSMGVFGFLSKAHLDQNIVSGEVMDKVALIDSKIQTEKDNIDSAKKALTQMDAQVNEMLSRSTDNKGTERAVQVRRQQAKERDNLAKEIIKSQTNISQLNQEKAPISKEMRKVEAEVGPIKYIAAFFYGSTDQNILEKAVTWVIMAIIFVFDPLAVILLLASQYSFEQAKGRKLFKEQAEGDSLTTEGDRDVVKETTVTTPVDIANIEPVKFEWNESNPNGFIAQEVADILPEIVVKEEPIVKKSFSSFKGFDVPKVNVTHDAKGIVPINLTAPEEVYYAPPPIHYTNTDNPIDFPTTEGFEVTETDLDAWNKMIAKAEEEVEKEFEQKSNIVSAYNMDERPGDYVQGSLTEVIEPEVTFNSYVQNEEQQKSNLWQEARKNVVIDNVESLSQSEYQVKVQQAIVRDLIRNINEGRIAINELSDAEADAVEQYLKKEKDDGENNSNKSA